MVSPTPAESGRVSRKARGDGSGVIAAAAGEAATPLPSLEADDVTVAVVVVIVDPRFTVCCRTHKKGDLPGLRLGRSPLFPLVLFFALSLLRGGSSRLLAPG